MVKLEKNPQNPLIMFPDNSDTVFLEVKDVKSYEEEIWFAELIEKRFNERDIPAHELRDFVNRLTSIAEEYAGTQQLRERIATCVRDFHGY